LIAYFSAKQRRYTLLSPARREAFATLERHLVDHAILGLEVGDVLADIKKRMV
jgi:hypothetical protein